MIKQVSRNLTRQKRHLRIRKTLSGTSSKPRLNVFRSNKQIYVQLIDDVNGHTLLQASSRELKLKNGGNIEAAEKVGKLIAEKASKAKITKVVFDRAGYLYHGRVKALADACRKAGLDF